MLKKELKLIVVFYTSSEAMATEKACKENGIEGKLISAPRDISSDCGISYATDVKNKGRIVELIKTKGIEFEKVIEMNL